jgi:hypothetical protein
MTPEPVGQNQSMAVTHTLARPPASDYAAGRHMCPKRQEGCTG